MAETIKEKLEETGHRIAEKATEVKNTVAEKAEEVADWAKEKTHQVGNKLEEIGQKAEHKYQETFGGEKGASCGTSQCSSNIQEHMDVIGSCGNKLGRVDHVEGSSIKLTKSDSPDGMHHFIPMSWVDHVDSHVHLNKNCGAARAEWQSA